MISNENNTVLDTDQACGVKEWRPVFAVASQEKGREPNRLTRGKRVLSKRNLDTALTYTRFGVSIERR